MCHVTIRNSQPESRSEPRKANNDRIGNTYNICKKVEKRNQFYSHTYTYKSINLKVHHLLICKILWVLNQIINFMELKAYKPWVTLQVSYVIIYIHITHAAGPKLMREDEENIQMQLAVKYINGGKKHPEISSLFYLSLFVTRYSMWSLHVNVSLYTHNIKLGFLSQLWNNLQQESTSLTQAVVCPYTCEDVEWNTQRLESSSDET